MSNRRPRVLVGLAVGALTSGALTVGAAGQMASADVAAGGTPTGSAPGWMVVPIPRIHGQVNLTAVTASNPSDAWAVGYVADDGTTRSLALHWDGRSWTHVMTPASGERSWLTAVSASSPSDVWAVGSDEAGLSRRTLVMHWDGTTWSIVPSPNVTGRDSVLNGVVAVSADDTWAVGSALDEQFTGHTLVQHWDGRSWSIIRSPNPSDSGVGSNLLAVTADTASDVWAVGDYDQGDWVMHPLAQRWDGRSWQTVDTPTAADGALLSSVATRAGLVWAVGWRLEPDDQQQLRYQPYAMRWEDGSWSPTDMPTFPRADVTFNDVTITPTGDVWTVGTHNTDSLTAQWSGSTWHVVASASPGAISNTLVSAAPIPGTPCLWAVGQQVTHQVQPLAERYCDRPSSPSNAE
jgi:hypothetical protein